MKISTKYDIGQTVYLTTDPDQNARLITGIAINPLGIMYNVTFCDEEVLHYEIHLGAEKNVLI